MQKYFSTRRTIRATNKHGFNHGFTLIEVLIVISLIGVLSSIFVSYYKGGGSASLSHEVLRFKNQWNNARTESQSLQKIIVLSIAPENYSFSTLKNQPELHLEKNTLQRNKLSKWSNVLSFNATSEDIDWDFEPLQDWYEVLKEDDTQETVLIMPSGDIIPSFDLSFHADGQEITLKIDRKGRMTESDEDGAES